MSKAVLGFLSTEAIHAEEGLQVKLDSVGHEQRDRRIWMGDLCSRPVQQDASLPIGSGIVEEAERACSILVIHPGTEVQGGHGRYEYSTSGRVPAMNSGRWRGRFDCGKRF